MFSGGLGNDAYLVNPIDPRVTRIQEEIDQENEQERRAEKNEYVPFLEIHPITPSIQELTFRSGRRWAGWRRGGRTICSAEPEGVGITVEGEAFLPRNRDP